ncbi:MAG: hypothetical protein ACP5VR_10090 [Acidimicrobiales bacterium]
MGKASSAKKVARAAGIGGSRAYGSQPPWMYYAGLLLLVLLGVIGVVNAREFRSGQINKNGNSPPTVGQSPPWYEGYAVEACGKLLPPIKTNRDPFGITTHGDGIIYISPTVKSAAGSNATLGKFANSVGMLLNAAEIQVPGQKLYTDGETCEGKAGHVYVMTWASPAEPASDGTLQDKKGPEDTCNPDCASGVLLEDDQLVTIAFLPAPPKGQTPQILQPPASVIKRLSTLEAAAATTTTMAPTTSTTSSVGKAATTTAPAKPAGAKAKAGPTSAKRATAKAKPAKTKPAK